MTVAPAEAYFVEIEAHFARRRNTPFILSAKDWALMKKWHADGVPLAVVIEAIDSVFEKNETSGRRKVISSLSYCRHAVKEVWQDRKELIVGDGETTPEAQLGEMLEALASDLERAGGPADVLAGTAREVRSLTAERSVPRIEERLIEIERGLIERLMLTTVSSIRDEAHRAIGDTSRLDEKTRLRTEEANLRRIVRERFGLPRLTLFR
jgi:hypothetical protein